MIESFINLKELERRPALAFAWAVLINTVAIIVTSQIQPMGGGSFGLFAVLFTILPSVLFLSLLIAKEERKDEKGEGFWETHGKDIAILLFFFFGLTISFAVWAFTLPTDAFSPQVDKINEIRGTGSAIRWNSFQAILLNNLQVMVVSFLLSLVFGAGVIFIIVWNASVLGVYIGQLSRSYLHIPLVSLSFLPHGIPEIAAYLLAGLAGGILSAAVMRRQHHRLEAVFLDSLKLLALGAAFLLIGAWVEVML